jgi:hypothetical protein
VRVETYKCDVCGAERKEANHWWKGRTAHARSNGGRGPVVGVFVSKWEAHEKYFEHATPAWSEQESHLCGENCVAQFVSKSLGND